MTTAVSTDAATPSHRWLRVGLILIAVLEFLDALSGVQNIFTDYHHPTAFLRFAQTLTSIKLALAPVIAGAALIYAALGNVRHAILAGGRPGDRDLAPGGCLVDPDGLKLSADCGGMLAFFHHFVFPAAALAGAALAFKDRRLPLSRPAGQRVDDCELGRRRRLHSRGHDVRFLSGAESLPDVKANRGRKRDPVCVFAINIAAVNQIHVEVVDRTPAQPDLEARLDHTNGLLTRAELAEDFGG